jgi:hypothetical protein
MKKVLVLGLMCVLASCGPNAAQTMKSFSQSPESSLEPDEVDSDESVLSPEQEEEYFRTYFPGAEKARAFKFSQTTWKECVDVVTGNYFGFNCSNSRGIASILKKFMDEHMYKCVNEGLAAQGGGEMDDMHIVHAGIFGDPNHSPRSMHAENRAIDIKSLEVKLTSGKVKNFIYEGTSSRPFYTAFRKCWGNIVNKHNGCPLYKGSALLTGSIGWEDSRHQHHMHTSVPYCVNGQYGPYYFKK